jgi:hypothetical protein
MVYRMKSPYLRARLPLALAVAFIMIVLAALNAPSIPAKHTEATDVTDFLPAWAGWSFVGLLVFLALALVAVVWANRDRRFGSHAEAIPDHDAGPGAGELSLVADPERTELDIRPYERTAAIVTAADIDATVARILGDIKPEDITVEAIAGTDATAADITDSVEFGAGPRRSHRRPIRWDRVTQTFAVLFLLGFTIYQYASGIARLATAGLDALGSTVAVLSNPLNAVLVVFFAVVVALIAGVFFSLYYESRVDVQAGQPRRRDDEPLPSAAPVGRSYAAAAAASPSYAMSAATLSSPYPVRASGAEDLAAMSGSSTRRGRFVPYEEYTGPQRA